MLKFAVMGNPISHSLSPLTHQTFAKQIGINLDYQRILVPLDKFETMVTDFFTQGGVGLNITMPFKERAFKLADKTSIFAAQVEAVNTLWQQDGILYGENTDGIGFIRDLKRYIAISEAEILIVGAGGAARSITLSLLEHNPKRLVVLNRTLAPALRLQSLSKNIEIATPENRSISFSLIIQTTPANYADIDKLLSCIKLKPNWFGYDLNYNSTEKTAFVSWVNNHNGQAVDGLGMLVEQAASAFYLWHGVRPKTGQEQTPFY